MLILIIAGFVSLANAITANCQMWHYACLQRELQGYQQVESGSSKSRMLEANGDYSFDEASELK